MNPLIAKFGKYVEQTVRTNPPKALALLKAAYRLSGWQMAYFPNKQLTPAQKYLAVLCNQAIQQPLRNPERSAVISAFLPCHALHAMNILPQFTEALACYLNGAGCEQVFIEAAEKSGSPKSYCSYHKVLLGAALSGVLPKPRFVINTTLACDANINTFRQLAEYYNIPQFVIDVPNSCTEQAVNYVARQLEDMTAFIEDVIQKKLDPDKLKESVRLGNRALSLYRSYLAELPGKFLTGDLTSAMYNIFPTHVLSGTPQTLKYFQLLLEDVRKAPPVQDQLRILWVHIIPFWQEPLREIFNFSPRYQIIAADLSLDSFSEIDENDIYKSTARKLLTNAYGGSIERRAANALQMARQLKADGVIYFNHWGCKATLGGAHYTKQLLQEAGFPTLVIDGDGCDRNNSNDGQILTRVQAFLEMLEERK